MREIMWAIRSKNFGLYYGTFPTRKEAIAHHIRWRGKNWDVCRKYGDTAVKVELTELEE